MRPADPPAQWNQPVIRSTDPAPQYKEYNMPSHYNHSPAGGPAPGPMPGGPMPGGPMPQGGTQDPMTGEQTKVSDIFARNGGDAFAVRDPSQSEAVQRTAQELGMAPEEVINAVEKELSGHFEERKNPFGGGQESLYGMERGAAAQSGAAKMLAQQGGPYTPNRGA